MEAYTFIAWTRRGKINKEVDEEENFEKNNKIVAVRERET